MPIELGTFQSFVDTDPQADRLALNDTAGTQGLENARSGNMLTWAVKVVAEYMPGLSGTVTAQNNDAVTAFRDALTQAYGPGANAHAPADGAGQPLSSRRINTAIQDTKAAIYDAATKADASEAERKAASEAIMRDVKLTPGLLRPMMEAEISTALLNLLPVVMPLDGTPRLDLIGKLGSQLVARLEDPLARALDAYAHQKEEGPRDPTVDDLVTKLSVEADPMKALLSAVPALRTHLDAEIKGFETSVRTLLSRVGADHAAIGERFLAGRFFAGPDAGRLTDIQLTNSDPHKGGNRVAILSFEAGLKVVYKPRDVRIDDAISGSDRGAKGPSLMQRAGAEKSIYRFMPMSDTDGQGRLSEYGYVQHLPNREASNHVVDASHAPAMFQELGRAAAALMLAGATDIHHENLMVSNGGMYFTDLEFALNRNVMNEFLRLLGGTPRQQPESVAGVQSRQPLATMEQLMKNIMLDKAFTLATDNNPLHANRPLENGQFTQAPMFQDVPESLLIIKTPTGFVNNRYAPPAPAPSIYQPYGAAFGQGVASGLIALKSQAGLTAFLQDIQGLHLRYHPLGTQVQREILQGVFHQDYEGALAGRGVKPLQKLQQHLQGINELASSSAKQEVLASTMQAAYAVHDIPYYSRVIGERNLCPDGQASQDKRCENFFPTDIDAHAGDLNAHFLRTPDSALTALGADAGRWLASQAPGEESAMPYLSPQDSDDMIQAVTGTRPVHRGFEDPLQGERA